jgi:intermediate cleaving peptidase 55
MCLAFQRVAIRAPTHMSKRFYARSKLVPDTHIRSFGQPTFQTHPNIMKKGQGTYKMTGIFVFLTLSIVTPGFNKSEFETRRAILMKSLPQDSVVVVLGNSIRYMTNNIFYPFHQNTDFWYLCGFNEPDAAMVLGKTIV